MKDASAFDFGKFIPGFDFLQQLAARPSGADAPAIGGWVAPTVSIEELERRIKELQAVQFWLNQNGAAIKATIQALEVQKMTLATLQGMNLGMNEVTKAFTLPKNVAAPPPSGAAWPYAAAPAQAPAPEPESKPAARARPARKNTRKPAAKSAPASGLADPVQWWNALTQQFQQIAANTLREHAGAATPAGVAPPAPPAAGAAQPGAESRKEPPKTAARKKAAASKTARKPTRKVAAKKTARKTAPAAGKPPAARSPLAGWPLPPPFKLGR